MVLEFLRGGDFRGFIVSLLLSLPIVLLSLSVHETAHGYIAHKLGDPTAYNYGRLSLNPIKHIDPIGFLCMILFGFGWAKPVPINTRYFENPRRDMAITGAAGPLSNLCLALIHLVVLRIVMIFATDAMLQGSIPSQTALTVLALVVYLLYMGVAMNVILAIFNLIPIPPFDGSRIFYAFLPTKWYFGVMKYERYIMFGCIVLFFALSRLGMNPLRVFEEWIIEGLFTLSGMGSGTTEMGVFNMLLIYLTNLMYA